MADVLAHRARRLPQSRPQLISTADQARLTFALQIINGEWPAFSRRRQNKKSAVHDYGKNSKCPGDATAR